MKLGWSKVHRTTVLAPSCTLRIVNLVEHTTGRIDSTLRIGIPVMGSIVGIGCVYVNGDMEYDEASSRL
jgi:hypothetical protein